MGFVDSDDVVVAIRRESDDYGESFYCPECAKSRDIWGNGTVTKKELDKDRQVDPGDKLYCDSCGDLLYEKAKA